MTLGLRGRLQPQIPSGKGFIRIGARPENAAHQVALLVHSGRRRGRPGGHDAGTAVMYAVNLAMLEEPGLALGP
jgi:hypothetical protein